MMDIISLVVESILAILALIIAIIQLIGENRVRAEEKREEEKITIEKKEIGEQVAKIKEMQQLTTNIKNFRSEMDKLGGKTKNNPVDVMEFFDKMVDGYEEDFRAIESRLQDLYRYLIKNEEKFPMAHGYGRYITDMRKILNYDEVLRQRRINGYDHSRMLVHLTLKEIWEKYDGQVSPELARRMGEQVEIMMQALEPYYDHADSIETLLNELDIKYGKK